MTGTPNPLDKPCNFTGGTKLDHMVNSANIYPQLHGGCADKRADFPALKPFLSINSHFFRQRAMMYFHITPFVQCMTQRFCSNPCIHKNKG